MFLQTQLPRHLQSKSDMIMAISAQDSSTVFLCVCGYPEVLKDVTIYYGFLI